MRATVVLLQRDIEEICWELSVKTCYFPNKDLFYTKELIETTKSVLVTICYEPRDQQGKLAHGINWQNNMTFLADKKIEALAMAWKWLMENKDSIIARYEYDEGL